MSSILTAASIATLITGVTALALGLCMVVPIEALNGIALVFMGIPLLFAYYSTGLPLGTASNGFVIPNAFGYAFLIASLWLLSFVSVWNSRRLSQRRVLALRDAKELRRESLPDRLLERWRSVGSGQALPAQMSRGAFPTLSVVEMARRHFRLANTEIQYWLLGLSYENYHLRKAGIWADLTSYERAISHLMRCLAVTDDVAVRAELALYHIYLKEWAQAAQEFAKVSASWPHPAVRLAHAEAELRQGSIAKGAEIIAAVEADFPDLDAATVRALDHLKAEFRLGV